MFFRSEARERFNETFVVLTTFPGPVGSPPTSFDSFCSPARIPSATALAPEFRAPYFSSAGVSARRCSPLREPETCVFMYSRDIDPSGPLGRRSIFQRRGNKWAAIQAHPRAQPRLDRSREAGCCLTVSGERETIEAPSPRSPRSRNVAVLAIRGAVIDRSLFFEGESSGNMVQRNENRERRDRKDVSREKNRRRLGYTELESSLAF